MDLLGLTRGWHIPGVKLNEKGTLLVTTWWDDAYNVMKVLINNDFPPYITAQNPTMAAFKKSFMGSLELFLDLYVDVAIKLKRSIKLAYIQDIEFWRMMIDRGIPKTTTIELLNYYVIARKTTSEIGDAMWNPIQFYREHPEIAEREGADPFEFLKISFDKLMLYGVIGVTVIALFYASPTVIRGFAKRK